MPIDKASVARRQLGTALALFLEDADPVSVHILACGGGEVAENLATKAGAAPFTEHALTTFPDLNVGDVRRLRNQYWNAFKHALNHKGVERDDDELFKKFTDEVNDHSLFVGWYDYANAVRTLPLEAQAFQVWYFALYPEKLDSDTEPDRFYRYFPTIKEASRDDQKRILRTAIVECRSGTALMRDPRTDPRPLILPAD